MVDCWELGEHFIKAKNHILVPQAWGIVFLGSWAFRGWLVMFYWAWDITPASAVGLSYLFVKQKYVLKKVDFSSFWGRWWTKKALFWSKWGQKAPCWWFSFIFGRQQHFLFTGKTLLLFRLKLCNQSKFKLNWLPTVIKIRWLTSFIFSSSLNPQSNSHKQCGKFI